MKKATILKRIEYLIDKLEECEDYDGCEINVNPCLHEWEECEDIKCEVKVYDKWYSRNAGVKVMRCQKCGLFTPDFPIGLYITLSLRHHAPALKEAVIASSSSPIMDFLKREQRKMKILDGGATIEDYKEEDKK